MLPPVHYPASPSPLPDLIVDGKRVKMLKHEVLLLDHPIAYDKKNGLGLFHNLSDSQIEDLLYDFLFDPQVLCTLCCTSKTWDFYARQEGLWKKIGRKRYKADFEFMYTWKNSVVIHHNLEVARKMGVEWVPFEVQSAASEYAPYFTGLRRAHLVKAYKKWFRTSINCEYMDLECPENIDRRSNLSFDDFITEYEIGSKPCIITDKIDSWPASERWTKETLLKEYGDVKFRAGSGIKMKLKNYISYAERNNDEYPLYLFDQRYPFTTDLDEDYEILDYWSEDIFKIVGEDDRPPYRWILVGTPRTGTPFHTDPRATSAWNALFQGNKRWILFPPDQIPPGVSDDRDSEYYESPEPIKWFCQYYKQLPKHFTPIQCIQRPGEILYIPSGWYHATYNIDETIAVTQNYASSCFFEKVAEDLSRDKDSFYKRLKKTLKEKGRQDLLDIFDKVENPDNQK